MILSLNMARRRWFSCQRTIVYILAARYTSPLDATAGATCTDSAVAIELSTRKFKGRNHSAIVRQNLCLPTS
jgi:hypothetical protein